MSLISHPDFNPFTGDISQETACAILAEACMGADDGDLYFQRKAHEVLAFDDGRLKAANVNALQGFGLRVVQGETIGYGHSPQIERAALQRAAETARLAAKAGGGHMAVAPQRTDQQFYQPADPLAEYSFATKVAAIRGLDSWIRAQDPRVKQVSISFSGGCEDIVILRPDGDCHTDSRPMTRLNISVIMEEKGRRESGSAGCGGRHGYEAALEETALQSLALEALRQAQVNLEAQEAPAGIMEVALGSGWCGVLLHEAVGHGLEGDFNRKKTSAFAGLMGEKVAAEGVTVIDDGAIPRQRGSINIDDEGEAGRRNVLIENGRLVGYLQDRSNARLMGTSSTGSGRRESYQHAPMPRMTNTFMAAGTADPDDIIGHVSDGIYAKSFGGGQVDITSGKFVFDCTEAYRVKNGKILHPVKGATLIGDGPSALHHVRLIGSDMALDPGMGMCGKAGQWVPVSVGQPSILIDRLTVGGKG